MTKEDECMAFLQINSDIFGDASLHINDYSRYIYIRFRYEQKSVWLSAIHQDQTQVKFANIKE